MNRMNALDLHDASENSLAARTTTASGRQRVVSHGRTPTPTVAANNELWFRHMFGWIGTAVLVSLVMGMLLMGSWSLFVIALPLGIAYVLLVTLPVFLAVVGGSEPSS